MRLTKRQLKRIIREEYSKLKRRGLINEMGFRDMRGGHGRQVSYQDMETDNYDACVQKCFAAIPPMMKKMCGMGMAHMVTNDIYHLCEPICKQMGCDCDEVSTEVEKMCCRR